MRVGISILIQHLVERNLKNPIRNLNMEEASGKHLSFKERSWIIYLLRTSRASGHSLLIFESRADKTHLEYFNQYFQQHMINILSHKFSKLYQFKLRKAFQYDWLRDQPKSNSEWMKYVQRYDPINWKEIELKPYLIPSAFQFDIQKVQQLVSFEELRKITRRWRGRFEEAKWAPSEACLKARVHRTEKQIAC